MRRIVVRLLVALLSVISFITPGWSQGPVTQELRIEIRGLPQNNSYGYSVRLLDMGSNFEIGHTYPDGSGVATFRSIPRGSYKLELTTAMGERVRQELIDVSQNICFIQVNLPQQQYSKPSGARISVTQLRHPPSRDAFKAFKNARKLSDSHEYAKAVAELEKATRLSPDFAEAHTNLAANYIRLGQFDRAAAESTRAMEIGSPNVWDLGNLALAEWGMHRYDDAIRSAGEALRLDADSDTANFVLGSLLARNPKTRREGIEHLERAADRSPEAAKNLEIARGALQEE